VLAAAVLHSALIDVREGEASVAGPGGGVEEGRRGETGTPGLLSLQSLHGGHEGRDHLQAGVSETSWDPMTLSATASPRAPSHGKGRVERTDGRIGRGKKFVGKAGSEQRFMEATLELTLTSKPSCEATCLRASATLSSTMAETSSGLRKVSSTCHDDGAGERTSSSMCESARSAAVRVRSRG